MMKKRCGGIDFLTRKPLSKTFNLHHLCLLKDEAHYTDLSDPDKYICLNKESHDNLHWLYRYWRKDKDILSRMEVLLEEMERLSSDGTNSTNGGANE